jgi:glycosyltransferase involved in cell wall biosynthesis
LKILFIATYFPPSLGGVENYVFNVALGLKQTYNAEVVVITANASEKKLRVEDYFGMKVYRLPVMMRVSNTPINPLWYFSLKRIIQEEKPDIINSHQPVMFMGDIAACVVGTIPFVLTYHAGTMKKKQLPIDIIIHIYEKFVLPHTAQKATKIICASEFVKDTLLKCYASKITVISPGVNTALYKPDPEVEREEKLVLFIARHKKMYQMKGLYYLIDAIKMLQGVRLHVVGEVDESTDENIEFVGVKQGEALVEEMQKASVVVLASLAHMESFGMVLIEAMACETPVVGTNIGGIPEVIRDGIDGFIVASRDSHALALAISKIVSDRELAARMGHAGEEKVRKFFTWDTRVALTERVFASCLK